MDILKSINEKYNRQEIFEFTINSKHKSFFEEEYRFEYSGRVLINNGDKNKKPADIIFFENGIVPVRSFISTYHYKLDDKTKKIYKKSINSPYKEILRGDFQWSTNSKFILNNEPLNINFWNVDSIHYFVEENNNEYIIEMCRDYYVDFNLDDSYNYEANKYVLLKVDKKTYWVNYIKEILSVSDRLEISEYNCTEFAVIDSNEYNFKKSNVLDFYNNFEIIEVKAKQTIESKEIKLLKKLNEDFLFYDLNENKFNLSDFKARYFVLDFWFCGCHPCTKVSKVLDSINNDFINIEFLKLNYKNHSSSNIVQCLGKKAIKSNIYYFKSNLVNEFIEIYEAPTVIIYDKKDGKILEKIIGYDDKFKVKILEKLMELNAN